MAMKKHRISSAIRLMSVLCLLCMVTAIFDACAQRLPVGKDSPSITGQKVTVGNSGTENSQRVTVTVTFDRPVKIASDAANQLTVTLNGKALDNKTMTWTVKADRSAKNKLLLTLSALPSAGAPGTGKYYFALYEGNLSVTAKSGSVSGITDQSGGYAAKWAGIHLVIPSGVALTTVSGTTGSAHTPAQTAARVAALGRVRAMTWVQFLQNGQPVMQKGYKHGSLSYTNDGSFFIHDHQFFQMRAEDYAKEIAEGLDTYFGKGTPTADKFTFSSDKDIVTIKANTPSAGQTLELKIYNSL